MQSHTQTNIFEQSHEYFSKTLTDIFINKTGTFFDTCDIVAHAKGKAYFSVHSVQNALVDGRRHFLEPHAFTKNCWVSWLGCMLFSTKQHFHC